MRIKTAKKILFYLIFLFIFFTFFSPTIKARLIRTDNQIENSFEAILQSQIKNVPYHKLLSSLKDNESLNKNSIIEKLISPELTRKEKLKYVSKLQAAFNLDLEAEEKLILAVQYDFAKRELLEKGYSIEEFFDTNNPARAPPFRNIIIKKHGETLWNALNNQNHQLSENMRDRISLILFFAPCKWGTENKLEVRKKMIKTVIKLGEIAENSIDSKGAYELLNLIEYFAGTKGIDNTILWIREDLKNNSTDNILALSFARELEEKGYRKITSTGESILHNNVEVVAINFLIRASNGFEEEADIILGIDKIKDTKGEYNTNITWVEVKHRIGPTIVPLFGEASTQDARNMLTPTEYREYLKNLTENMVNNYSKKLTHYRNLIKIIDKIELRDGRIIDLESKQIIYPNDDIIHINNTKNLLFAINFENGSPFRTDLDEEEFILRLQNMFSKLPNACFFDNINFTFFDINTELEEFIKTCTDF